MRYFYLLLKSPEKEFVESIYLDGNELDAKREARTDNPNCEVLEIMEVVENE